MSELEEKDVIKFAEDFKMFIDINFDGNGDEYKLRDDCPYDFYESLKKAKEAIDNAFPNLQEDIIFYSINFSMEYLIKIKRLYLLLDLFIKNNLHFEEKNV